jgi:integrase
VIIRVLAPALSHLRPALRLTGPARPVIGRQGRRLALLQHEAAVLHRTHPRPRLNWADRAVFAAPIRLLPVRCAADGRLFRGARGSPLSESLHGRIWHQAHAAAIPGQAGTRRARRPYDLRHAALSLWLAAGAPPAEVAARAGHSVRVLLAVYAHCIPGCDQIASQHIEEALNPSHWPPAGP